MEQGADSGREGTHLVAGSGLATPHPGTVLGGSRYGLDTFPGLSVMPLGLRLQRTGLGAVTEEKRKERSHLGRKGGPSRGVEAPAPRVHCPGLRRRGAKESTAGGGGHPPINKGRRKEAW